jgi:endoglucanase
VRASQDTQLQTYYSYDALRLAWRLALDWKWYGEPRAKETLDKLNILSYKWHTDHKLLASYTHDGKAQSSQETPAMYGGSLGYFIVSDPAAATAIYEDKLKSLYTMDTNAWKDPLGYYDDNWAWFGIALYTNQLPNIAKSLTNNPT